jgi:DNA-binding Lrp family transcriptional regulator
MPIVKTVQVPGGKSLDLEAKVIAAIETVGPRNIAEIARITGAHQETIRYKIKKRFVKRGFRFQAEVDYGKLGLTLHWGRFVVSPIYYESAPKFFAALGAHGYLTHYAKILPSGHFVALFALPTGKGEKFRSFLRGLQKRKVIADFDLDKVEAERHKPMDVSQFDFKAGRWEANWSKIRESRGSPLVIDRTPKSQLADETDLKIVKELQINALQHATEIARKLKMNEKTVEYHYRAHVVKESLIPRYRVRWMRDLTRRVTHSLTIVRMTFNGLDDRAYERVQSAINRIPFLWVEARLEHGTYVATLAIPVSEVMETMSYLNEEIQYLGPKADIGFLRDRDSYNFTIPYEMFVEGEWEFDPRKMETAAVAQLSKSLKK